MNFNRGRSHIWTSSAFLSLFQPCLFIALRHPKSNSYYDFTTNLTFGALLPRGTTQKVMSDELTWWLRKGFLVFLHPFFLPVVRRASVQKMDSTRRNQRENEWEGEGRMWYFSGILTPCLDLLIRHSWICASLFTQARRYESPDVTFLFFSYSTGWIQKEKIQLLYLVISTCERWMRFMLIGLASQSTFKGCSMHA